MEKIDLAIIVVGVVVLAAALTGAALYTGGEQLTTYEVTWTLEEHEGDAQRASVEEDGGEVEFLFEVNRTNLRNATFEVVLETQGSHVSTDTMEVVVEAPNGNTTRATGTLQTTESQLVLEVTLNLTDPPEPTTVEAGSQDAGREILWERFGSTLGTGNWTVTVTVDHGGVTGLGSGHTLEVTPTYVDYHPELTPRVGDLEGV